MESDHPEPVVRYWVAGFFIAVLTISVPVTAIHTDRVKSSYKGTVPSPEQTSIVISQT